MASFQRALALGWQRSIVGAPVALAIAVGFYVFFVILPFRIACVDPSNPGSAQAAQGGYAATLGDPAQLVALCLTARPATPILSIVWLLGLIQFVRARKWWMLVVLALFPLVMAYVNSGPNNELTKLWIGWE